MFGAELLGTGVEVERLYAAGELEGLLSRRAVERLGVTRNNRGSAEAATPSAATGTSSSAYRRYVSRMERLARDWRSTVSQGGLLSPTPSIPRWAEEYIQVLTVVRSAETQRPRFS